MSHTYTFIMSGDGRHYTVIATDGERRRKTLPSVIADRSFLYPMLDALVATLLDWLGDVPDAELQATLLAKPLVGRVNRLVAKHKNRSWNNFVLTETEVEAMVTQILTDSYSLRSMGEVFVEYIGGRRTDRWREAR